MRSVLPNPEHLPAVRAFDDAVDRALDRHRGPALDALFYRLSSAADHSLIWFTIGGLRAWRRTSVGFAVRFGVVMGLESAITNGAVKSLFRRGRPVVEDETAPLPYGMRRPITSSFPSGHATAAFTAAPLLAASGGPASFAWYGLAALVASSRVYVRMHHASDVVAGAVLGLAMGHVAKRLLFRSAG